MTDSPPKRVPAALGRRLFNFVEDENVNFQNAAYDLIEEMHFFDKIADSMDKWINRDAPILPGESVFYSLCSFARTQLFQGCSSYMRGHLSAGMVASRLCLEAALYGEAIAANLMTEEQYLSDDRKRAGLPRQLRNLQSKGLLPNSRIPVLLDSISTLSAHGAHAEVRTWGNRLVGTDEEGWFLSFFQKAKSPDHFTYNFLGIIWFAGLAFVTFLEIANDRFGIDTAPELDGMRRWQDAMEENKTKLGIYPN